MFNRHQISNRLATFAGLAVLALLMAVPNAVAMPEGSGRAAPQKDATRVTAKCATKATVAATTIWRSHPNQEIAPRQWRGRVTVPACGTRLAAS